MELKKKKHLKHYNPYHTRDECSFFFFFKTHVKKKKSKPLITTEK